jgi:hypothetical protein
MSEPSPSDPATQALSERERMTLDLFRWILGRPGRYTMSEDAERDAEVLLEAAALRVPSDEEVERAARALYKAPAYGRANWPPLPWGEDQPGHLEFDREQYRIMARAALDAARGER